MSDTPNLERGILIVRRAVQLFNSINAALTDGRVLSDDVKRRLISQQEVLKEVLYGQQE